MRRCPAAEGTRCCGGGDGNDGSEMNVRSELEEGDGGDDRCHWSPLDCSGLNERKWLLLLRSCF